MAVLPSLLSKDPFSPTQNDFSFNPHVYNSPRSVETVKICASLLKQGKFERTHQRFLGLVKRKPISRTGASTEPLGMTKELTEIDSERSNDFNNDLDRFSQMKHRFLRFKKQEFLKNSDHFQKLAELQSPEFMVIACADSRVCPSHILGFQPGEAFTIRNVANLVPPFENGLCETSAALEFAVNSLQVGNILIVGHSRCGGIRALMSMQDEDQSSFISGWVTVGQSARLSTKAATTNLSFDQQCRHCEKESINRSLLNLLTYPWIEERVKQGQLSLHGGYYNFIDGTFEKWTLQHMGNVENGCKYAIKDRAFWC